jgi:hypothetical protein
MTPDQKRLADRILKLLALAGSTSFAAEAETARTMAEDLIKRHNISLTDIAGKPAQNTIERREYIPFAKGMRWEGMIVSAITDLCSCVFFFDSETLDSYELVGSIWNLDIVEYMLREVNRQRIVAWLNYKVSGPDSFNKFCYGFAQALQSKINSIASTNLDQEQSALTLWYETNYLHGNKTEAFQLANGQAKSQAGIAAGDNTSLHRGALGTPLKRLR